MRRVLLATALAIVVAASGASAAGPALTFSAFAQTDLSLGQVMWTGSAFLYLSENDTQIETADAKGGGVRRFAAFPDALGGEEVRCVVPVIAYWPDGIYCHLPDNRIYRIARDGSSMTLLAKLPGAASDGALAFDSGGRFGYALLAATGGSASGGGEIYAVRKDGRVQLIGPYAGPGGADEIAIAPPKFGSASSLLLIAIDKDTAVGRLLAIDRHGKVQLVADSLGNGLNPIVTIDAAPAARKAGQPAAGLYLSDTNSKAIYFTPASALQSYVGQVVVGSELEGNFWAVKPRTGGGFTATTIPVQLPNGNWNLEGAVYIP
jgi:hypothetical protein